MKKSNATWQKFLHSCAKLKTTRQFDNFFAVLLTPAEQEDIAARYTILTKLLEGKKTQREIAKELKISIAKISRGSNALKTADKKTLEIFHQ
jgi:TrpR family transcriptional regulator, trp operon repressor